MIKKRKNKRTVAGNMKASQNRYIHGGYVDKAKDSQITKMLKDCGVDFSIPEKAMEARRLFKLWLDKYSPKQISELERLDRLIELLDVDMAQRVMEKISMGVSLDRDDVRAIRLLKDTLEATHKLKHGEKHVNLYADLDDMRRMALEE
jgi:hypothetical protein